MMKIMALAIIACLLGLAASFEAYQGPMDLNVKVSSTLMNMSYEGIKWMSASSGYALQRDGTVKATYDYGVTWEHKALTNIRDIFVQWTSNNGASAIFVDREGNSYITKDSGKTIKPSEFNVGAIEWVEFHPMNENWAFVLGRGQANHTFIVHVTLSFASTNILWTQVEHMPAEVQWCAPETDSSKLCMIMETQGTPRALCVTTDFINCVFPINLAYVHYMRTFPYHFVVSTNEGLFITMDTSLGPNTFHKGELPGGMNITSSWPEQFVEYRRKNIWFANEIYPFVDRLPQPMALYISDREGYKFSPTLWRLHSFQGMGDISRVASVNGTYVANEMFEYSNGAFVSPKTNASLTKTRITYDYGANWYFLAAPETDSAGRPIVCDGICSLNFYGQTSWFSHGHFGGIYSKEEAVGVIVANGNVGDFLNWDASTANTYASTDGGRSWKEIFQGTYDVSYGQNSGILVLVKLGNETRSFQYSLDNGNTFKEQAFSPANLTVYRLYNFDGTGDHFIIDASQNGEFMMITLDFTTIFERNCTSSDYSLWTPEAPHSSTECLNGEVTTYNLRKYNAECNGITEPVASVKSCDCTRADYECDYDYSPMINGDCYGTPPPAPYPCPEGQSYSQTQGYRRVADNNCTMNAASAKYDRILVKCPNPVPTTSSSSSTGTVTGTVTHTSTGTGTGTASMTSTSTHGGSTGSSSGQEKGGVSSGGAAAGIIIVAIFVGIIAFVLGVFAAFRSTRVRSAVPADWRAGERVGLL